MTLGSKLTDEVFDAWPGIKGRDKTALVYMASKAIDGAQPPRFFGDWKDLAWAISYDAWNDNPDTARAAVKQVLKSLRDAGVIVTSGNARHGVKAEYALALEPGVTYEPVTDGRQVEWNPIERVPPAAYSEHPRMKAKKGKRDKAAPFLSTGDNSESVDGTKDDDVQGDQVHVEPNVSGYETYPHSGYETYPHSGYETYPQRGYETYPLNIRITSSSNTSNSASSSPSALTEASRAAQPRRENPEVTKRTRTRSRSKTTTIPNEFNESKERQALVSKVMAIAQLRADHAKNSDIEKAVDSFANDLAQVLSVGAEDFKRLIAAGNWYPPTETAHDAYGAGRWLNLFLNKASKAHELTYAFKGAAA